MATIVNLENDALTLGNLTQQESRSKRSQAISAPMTLFSIIDVADAPSLYSITFPPFASFYAVPFFPSLSLFFLFLLAPRAYDHRYCPADHIE